MTRPPDPRREEQIATNVAIGAQAEEVPVAERMTPDQMLERCVFVESGKRVAILPDPGSGQRVRVLTLDEFCETYSSSGEERGNRWAPYPQAWRRSPFRKTVPNVALGIGRSRMLTDADTGAQVLNLWTPKHRRKPTARGQQGAGQFWRHLEYLVPNEAERRHFIQWLAHCEQQPEKLPHHGVLMISETHGIGRNWFASALCRVWPGETAVAVNLPKLIDSDFNGSISGRRLAVVDECQAESGKSRYAVQATFREIVTAETRTVNPKYGRQYTEWNVLRWLLFSNHWNAMPLPEGDRRLMVIANPTAKQSADYYAQLYNLLADREMIDAVAHDLANTDISSFNPGAEPPVNAAKRRVIDEGKTDFERDLRALLEAWQADVAAAGDLLKAIDVEPEGKAAAQFGAVMRKAGWINQGQVRVHGHKERVWFRPGAEPREGLAAAVAAYRGEEWFKKLTFTPF